MVAPAASVGLVGEGRSCAGPALHHDRMASCHQFPRAGRGQRDPILVGLDLRQHSHAHGALFLLALTAGGFGRQTSLDQQERGQTLRIGHVLHGPPRARRGCAVRRVMSSSDSGSAGTTAAGRGPGRRASLRAGIPGRRRMMPSRSHRPGDQAGFLAQLAHRRLQRFLPGLQRAGGQFEEPFAHGVAVLPDQRHVRLAYRGQR